MIVQKAAPRLGGYQSTARQAIRYNYMTALLELESNHICLEEIFHRVASVENQRTKVGNHAVIEHRVVGQYDCTIHRLQEPGSQADRIEHLAVKDNRRNVRIGVADRCAFFTQRNTSEAQWTKQTQHK